MSTATDSGKGDIFRITLNLTLAAILSGAVISAVFFLTEPYAAQQKIIQEQQALKELVSAADEFKPVYGKPEWFTARREGQAIAYLVPCLGRGYGGKIRMLLAVDTGLQIIAYKVLSHNETPGLGDRAGKPEFSAQFAGKRIENLEVVKVHADGKIDAITGATITSRAVTLAIKEALELLAQELQKHPGGDL